VLFSQGGGGYGLEVQWQGPNIGKQTIANDRLSRAAGGGCTPPAAPSLSASPTSINAGQSSTLSASGCGGTVAWSTGQTGNSITVSPAQTTTYTATCSESGCVSGNGNVTITVNGGGGGCATGNFNGHLDYVDCANFGG